MTNEENTEETMPEPENTEDKELEELLEETPEPETAEPEEVPTEAEAEPEEEEKKEEEEKPTRKKKGKEEEVIEERFYTVPLRKASIRPPKKRAPRAIQILRTFITKHMKLEMPMEEEEEEAELPTLIISNEVNEKIWGKGIEKPPKKIRVRAAKDSDGNVTVYLAEGE